MLIRFKKSLIRFFEAFQCSGLTLESQPNFITKNGQPISVRESIATNEQGLPKWGK